MKRGQEEISLVFLSKGEFNLSFQAFCVPITESFGRFLKHDERKIKFFRKPAERNHEHFLRDCVKFAIRRVYYHWRS